MAYNGWSNYETWVVKLWIDNDEGSYRYWGQQAEEAMEFPHHSYEGQSDEDAAKSQLADMLKDEHEEALPDVEGFASDLLRAGFGEVDWYEIAGALLEEAKEGVTA